MLSAYLIEYLYYDQSAKDSNEGYYMQSNIFYIEQDKTYDFLVMGSSTAGEVRPCFVPTLSKNSSLNISFPGGGLAAQKTYLEYFLSKNNKTSKILYCIDPYVLFTGYGDRENYLFEYEPFRLGFTYYIIKNLDIQTATRYLFGKVKIFGFTNYVDCPIAYPSMENALDPRREKAQLNAYYNATDESSSQKELLMGIIKTAQAHNISIHFYIPPSLIKDDPNYSNLISFLEDVSTTDDVQFSDFREVFQNAASHKFFRDYVHLNATGVRSFFDNYLVDLTTK